MSSITEIEDAIQKLPSAQIEELANWLEQYRSKRASKTTVDEWLESARGAASAGESTSRIMSLTRGES